MGKDVTRPSLEYYLSLRYPFLVYPPEDEDGVFVAEVPDLPGRFTQAPWVKLYEMIEDAKLGWLTVAYEEGDDIPLPRLAGK
ncbi:MAG: type II toxin-antitoxin system HicB family antitoxin [Chloroflexi bacterium]|nr:type II toxin-antitoxin system HicB family antitoxin [Bacteroidota bacterium]MCL5110970.1 type II toxin-antitoxin system HicB family antitoxin [Chloroflexota bacterium]